MKRIAKYWHLCLTAAFVMGFSACTEEYEYDPTTDTDNQGAYIVPDNPDNTGLISIVITEDQEQSFTFSVARPDNTQAATYSLYSSDESVTIPSEVSFAAGESIKQLTATFDVPAGTVAKRITIGVSDENAYEYGRHTQTYAISRLRELKGCQMLGIGGIWVGAALWEMTIYENGTVTDKEGNVVSASYLIRDPYNYPEVGLPDDCVGQGNEVVFTINSDGTATTGANSSLFYCAASFTGDASVVGDLLVSGSGTYYTEPTTLVEGFTASNFVLFNWDSRIGTTAYGFGTCTHAIIFPDNYDPLTQTMNTTQE